MNSFRTVPPKMRHQISRPLIDLGTAASRIGSALWESEPAQDSRASTILAGRPVSASAFSDVSIALAAGSDHYHALARLIRLEEEFGPSIAALTRSCIETLGRGWWLLESTDAAQMEHRAAAAAVKEQETAARKGVASVRVFDDHSRRTDVADPVGEARAHLANVQVAGVTETVPGYGPLAMAIMEAAGTEKPAAMYSHLSGVAHGESSTVGGLGSRRATALADQVAAFSMGLPIRNARTYLITLTTVLDTFMSRLIALWGIRAHEERWEQVRGRTFTTFDELFNALVRAPEPVP